MSRYKRPAVYIEEVESGPRPIKSAGTSTPVFFGTAEKGPIDSPEKVRSFDEAKGIFGNILTNSYLMRAVKAFFDEGGSECYINRQAHYTDPTDASTLVAVAAVRTLDNDGGAAEAAVYTADAGPYEVFNGWQLDMKVDGGGSISESLSMTQGEHTGTVDLDTSPYTPASAQDLVIQVNGGPQQTVTFTPFAYDAAAAAQLIADNTTGLSVTTDGSGHIVIRTANAGTGQSFVIHADTDDTLATSIGITEDTYTGTGDCADSSAMTAAELVAALSFTGATLSDSSDALVITSDTTGASSSLEIESTSTSAFITELGGDLAVGTVTGSDAGGTSNVLKLWFGRRGEKSEGEKGNEYKVKVYRDSVLELAANAALGSAVTAADTTVELTSVAGLKQYSVLKFEDGTNTEYVTVSQIRRVVSGGSVTFYADIDGSFSNSFSVALTAVTSQEFTVETYYENELVEQFQYLSMDDDSDDYVETVLNDELTGSIYLWAEDLDAGIDNLLPADDSVETALAGGTSETSGLVAADKIGDSDAGTGIYAVKALDDISILVMPGETDVSVLSSLLAMAEDRMDCFCILDTPEGYSYSQLESWRTATLGADSSYGACYAPWLEVADPIGAGKNPKINVPPSGHLAGLYARVDALAGKERGPWTSPAGAGQYGKLRTPLDVNVAFTNGEHEVLNPVAVNAILKKKGKGIVVMGARTLSQSLDWQYISARRSMIFFQQSIATWAQGEVFRNNNSSLWTRLKDGIDKFLSARLRDGAMPATTKADAFFILLGIDDGTMTQGDVDSGKVIGRIGIALQKPGEFLIFQFEQYKGTASLSE